MKRIGAFYKEKILSLPKKSLTMREAPYLSPENMKIERDLFGWKIWYTRSTRKSREYIECRSEEEARYLKVLLDVGMREIFIPKDDEYLKSILPELELLKKKTDEILNSYLESILNRQIRAQLKHEVYMEIAHNEIYGKSE